MAAMYNMGALAKPAVSLMEKQLYSDERFIPMHAACVLASIGEDGVPPLVKSLSSDDEDIRYEAIVALGDMGMNAKSAIPALEIIVKSDRQFSVHAKHAISLIGQPPSMNYWVYGKPVEPMPEIQETENP